MARRKADEEEEKFNGKFNVKKFHEAAKIVSEEHQIPEETIDEILKTSIDKAVRETLYPNVKTKAPKKFADKAEVKPEATAEEAPADGEVKPVKLDSASDMHSETVIDSKSGEISFYECKDVMNDEDITDDLYQISLEDAKEEDPDIKVGDVLKTKVDLSGLDYAFFTRAIQSFMQGIREATKTALIDRYKSRIGQIISGVVDHVEGKDTYVMVGRVMTILNSRNSIPGETFTTGDTVKMLLDNIGTVEENGDKSTTLMVSRTSNKYLSRLFEQEIPDVADGSVIIKNVVREPGVRAKVAVYATSPDIDPTGACIGSDGQRIKSVCSQLFNEKIDVIHYQENPELYIAEALKPATVVGVSISDEEPEEGKQVKATAVVKNGEFKIAVGKKGVNARLASRLTGYSIDIEQIDDAMAKHISYDVIDDIRRKDALALLDKEEAESAAKDEAELANAGTEEAVSNETATAAPEAANEAAVNEVKAEEPVKTEAAPAEKAAPAPVKEEKPVEEKPVEHVEIVNTAKVSLNRLEAEIEAEKNKKKQQPRSFKRRFDKKEDENKDKKIVVANAMPIYTEEEEKEIAAEDQSKQTGSEEEGNEDYSEYDSDQYYDDNEGKR